MDIKLLDKKLIIANSISNARKYVLQQALNGNPLFNYEINTPYMLVSSFIAGKNRLISDKETSYILFNLIKNSSDNYNIKTNINTIGAVNKLLEIINDFRLEDISDFKYVLEGD